MKVQEQGKVTFKQAFKDYWRGYIDFEGNTTRAGYWWMFGFNALVYAILFAIIGSLLFVGQNFWILPFVIIVLLYYLVTLIPNITKQTRRFTNLGITLNLSLILTISYKVIVLFFASILFVVWILDLLPQDFFKQK